MSERDGECYTPGIDSESGRLKRWRAKETHHVAGKSESLLWDTQHIAVENIIQIAVMKNRDGIATRSHSAKHRLHFFAGRLHPHYTKGFLKKCLLIVENGDNQLTFPMLDFGNLDMDVLRHGRRNKEADDDPYPPHIPKISRSAGYRAGRLN